MGIEVDWDYKDYNYTSWVKVNLNGKENVNELLKFIQENKDNQKLKSLYIYADNNGQKNSSLDFYLDESNILKDKKAVVYQNKEIKVVDKSQKKYFQWQQPPQILPQQQQHQQQQQNIISKEEHQKTIKDIKEQYEIMLNIKDDQIKNLQKIMEDLENENKHLGLRIQELLMQGEQQTVKQTYKKDNQNQKQRFKDITNDMAKQFNVFYENLQDFQQKFKLGEVLGSGSYGTVRELIKIQEDSENQELVVKQLDCQNFDQEQQENEVVSLKKVQLLPEDYRKSILEAKNVYWDPIKQKINMVLPKAKYSLEQEIQTKIVNNTTYSQQELCIKISSALEGLFTLETLGMAHRDIKTSNMLIMQDGKLVIADLGTAKRLDYQIATMTIGVGTQKFWPPEQIDTYDKLKNEDYYQYIQSAEANRNFKANDLYGVGLSFVIAASLSKLPGFKVNKPKFLQVYKDEREEWLKTIFARLREEKKYSPDLIALLENMVSENVYQRLTLIQSAQKLLEIQNW